MRYFPGRWLMLALFTLGAACAPANQSEPTAFVTDEDIERPFAQFGEFAGIELGEPLGLSLDFNENIFVADGSPARVMKISQTPLHFQEFQLPTGRPGFYPTDLAVQGFFVYVVDRTGRSILRFDKEGAYRDVLLDFDELAGVRRVSPSAIGVDQRGRVVVADAENHQILLFDSYLVLDVAFGNYGSFSGQLDTPGGVSFDPDGDIVVADTGNRRIQFFSDGGSALRVVPAEGEPNPLRSPRRAVVDLQGRLLVADPGAGRVFVFGRQGKLVRSLFPEGSKGFGPTDLAVSRDGTLYVTDAVEKKLFVFKVM